LLHLSVQFYLNNFINLHQLTSHSTTTCPTPEFVDYCDVVPRQKRLTSHNSPETLSFLMPKVLVKLE